jgi:hypothetical protein
LTTKALGAKNGRGVLEYGGTTISSPFKAGEHGFTTSNQLALLILFFLVSCLEREPKRVKGRRKTIEIPPCFGGKDYQLMTWATGSQHYREIGITVTIGGPVFHDEQACPFLLLEMLAFFAASTL